MKPSQILTDVSDQPSVPSGFTDINHLREFSGRYYCALGWIDLISSIIALAICYWTGHLAITFSCALWFWLGDCLKQGNPVARKWAIAIPFIIGLLFTVGFLLPGLSLRIAPWGIDATHPAYIPLAGFYLVAHAIVGLMLAGDRGRRAFSEQKDGEQGGDGDAEEAV